ncbi:MAG TPA: peptide MFS transporter [Sphingomonas sp.]
MTAIAGSAAPARDHAADLFGHPRGLFFLAGTELWERFSFYGMQALLVLYMVDWLLLPDHAAHVLGLATVRRAAEAISGPLGAQAFASELFGLYAGLAYFTPLIGGLVGDRLLGPRRTVMLGVLLMAAGHLLMAFDRYFLVALGLLIGGCGCLKGNITAQVGRLYPSDDPRRARAFAIFNMSINAGGLLGPFLCGAVGEVYGWHKGFGLAGGMMMVALVVYMAGRRWMPADRREPRIRPAPLAPGQWRNLAGIALVLILGLFFSIPYYQLGNAYILFLQDRVDRDIFGITLPATSLMGLDSLFVIAGTPVILASWRRRATRAGEPGDLTKIAIACLCAAAAYAQLAVAASGGGAVSPIHALIYSGLLGIGFVYYWPTTLALISRLAPPELHSTLMGGAFLTMFASFTAVGWIGSFYGRMAPDRFWLIEAAIALAGAALILATKRPVTRLLLLSTTEKDIAA